MVITRISDVQFTVKLDTVLADGSHKFDDDVRLNDTTLRSHEQRGHIRTGGLVSIQLGPTSFAIVTGLQVGESADMNLHRVR